MGTNPTAERLLATWEVPLQGVLHHLPIYQIPPTGLYDSENVLLRAGSLQVRPGLTIYNNTPVNGRVVGGYSAIAVATGAFQDDAFQNDAFQVSGNAPASTLVIATPSKIYFETAAGWQDATDTPLLAGDDDHARFTSIYLSNVLHTLMTNGVDAPRDLRSDAAVVTVVAGTPPKFTDWTTLPGQARIVGIDPPYDVRWCNAADIGAWPALNNANLSGTPDRLIAIRNLGTLGVAVYKTHTVWIGEVTGLESETSVLRFELRGWFDGPASPAALVDAVGLHYYMTETGRIAAFSGTEHRWVADGVWPKIRPSSDEVVAELNPDRTGRIFGVYEPVANEVWFYYPRRDDPASDGNRGFVCVRPPNPMEGVNEHIAFTGKLAFGVSTGLDLRMSTKDVMLFGSTDKKTYKLTGTNDAGSAITGHWQTGFAKAPGIEPHRIEAVETFAQRGANYGSLTVKPVTSYILDNPGGTLGPAHTVALTNTTAVKDLKGTDARGRFLGLRYEFTTPITLRWRGARLLGVQTK